MLTVTDDERRSDVLEVALSEAVGWLRCYLDDVDLDEVRRERLLGFLDSLSDLPVPRPSPRLQTRRQARGRHAKARRDGYRGPRTR